jgi:hypothetical protein
MKCWYRYLYSGTSVCIHPWYIYTYMCTYTAVNFRYRALNNVHFLNKYTKNIIIFIFLRFTVYYIHTFMYTCITCTSATAVVLLLLLDIHTCITITTYRLLYRTQLGTVVEASVVKCTLYM